MPKRTAKPSTIWSHVFAYAWLDLADGRGDLENLTKKGERLRRMHQREKPRVAAARDFASAVAQNRELIAGFNAS